ncbi:MAG: hypothetical protein GY913_03025 [Proteobacteria bacterium]|nr:hypothetical protein [Pseudomonadota bacterium]MCP4915872.1 hypothetical protein [Pseudomonadota bacterium]
MKATVTNKTDDYVVYRLGESTLHIDAGDYQAQTGLLKGDLVLEPKKSGSRTVEFKDGTEFHVEAFTLDITGIYKTTAMNDVEAPNFKLPAAVNDFEAGAFECNLAGLKQETKETKADFKCTYTGEGLGFVTPSKASVEVEGQKFANNNKRAKTKVLQPGDDTKFTLVYNVPAKVADMQFANMEIVWDGVLEEATLEQAPMDTITFELDPGKTAGKN